MLYGWLTGDLNWELISVPHYTKDFQEGASMGFTHLDMHVDSAYYQGRRIIPMTQGV